MADHTDFARALLLLALCWMMTAISTMEMINLSAMRGEDLSTANEIYDTIHQDNRFYSIETFVLRMITQNVILFQVGSVFMVYSIPVAFSFILKDKRELFYLISFIPLELGFSHLAQFFAVYAIYLAMVFSDSLLGRIMQALSILSHRFGLFLVALSEAARIKLPEISNVVMLAAYCLIIFCSNIMKIAVKATGYVQDKPGVLVNDNLAVLCFSLLYVFMAGFLFLLLLVRDGSSGKSRLVLLVLLASPVFIIDIIGGVSFASLNLFMANENRLILTALTLAFFMIKIEGNERALLLCLGLLAASRFASMFSASLSFAMLTAFVACSALLIIAEAWQQRRTLLQ